jgi:hypothetical protein
MAGAISLPRCLAADDGVEERAPVRAAEERLAHALGVRHQAEDVRVGPP